MKRLPATASDEDVLRWVAEWVDLLAQESYQDAYDALFHPKWDQMTPEAMEAIRRTDPGEWERLRQTEDLYEPTPAHDITPDLLRQLVRNYGFLPEEGEPEGTYRVTPVEEARHVDLRGRCSRSESRSGERRRRGW